MDKEKVNNKTSGAKKSGRGIVIAAIAAILAAVCIVAVSIMKKNDTPEVNYDDTDVSDSAEISEEDSYLSALELYNKGDYEAAYRAFGGLNYKDSLEKAAECLLYIQQNGLKTASVGSTVSFGSFEQDNDLTNGKEEIEWIVLSVEDGEALLLSKYALDCHTYQESYSFATWENSSVRSWLNGEFYDSAFDPELQKLIVLSEVPAEANPDYDLDPGNDTTDRVFLLSIKEADLYFDSDEARRCKPTSYCISRDILRRTDGSCRWWLRTRGKRSSDPTAPFDNAACVFFDGTIYTEGFRVWHGNLGVRPAIRVKIDQSGEM